MTNVTSTAAIGPILETGLAVATQGERLLDPYRVSALHDLFRSELPNYERQPPIEGIQVFPGSGAVISPLPPVIFEPAQPIPNSRWWFLSPNGDRLMQLQEDFIAHSWRRMALPPAVTSAYPGYESMKGGLMDAVRRVSEWKASTSEEMCSPRVVELLYDNLIPLSGPDGKIWRMRDVLSEHTTASPVVRIGWNSDWFETIPDHPQGDAKIRIAMRALASPLPTGESRPFLRITLTSRAAVGSWSEVPTFLDSAHKFSHSTLDRLTTAEIKSTWKQP